MTSSQASKSLPSMVLVHEGLYVNRERLRRLRLEGDRFALVLDDGSTLVSLHRSGCQSLAVRLGLSRCDHLEPRQPGMLEHRLRDYPVELATASAEQLKAWFDSPRQLIANLIYQAMRYRQMGIAKEYGNTHRGFWYVPIYATLFRAGFGEGDTLLVLYRRVIDELIGDDRLFTYQELGFKDPNQRHLGDRRPEVVMLVEKESLEDNAIKLASQFGVTYMVSGGTPKLVDTEYLVAALRALGLVKVLVISYGDFDPEGWALADGFVAQLERYDMAVEGSVRHLVRAECFTEDELTLYAMPCPAGGPAAVTLAEEWVRRSGGIHGKAWGIHGNHLPFDRVMAELAKLL
jgi:hypothetical protein